MAHYYVWQKPHPEPAYRHPGMRRSYYDSEMNEHWKGHPSSQLALGTMLKGLVAMLLFAGFALLPPIIMMRRVFYDRRVRFLVQCVVVAAAGMLVGTNVIAHYLAPFTAAFYAIGLQAMRHPRHWWPEHNPVGRTLVRLTVTLCMVLGAGRVFANQFGFNAKERPENGWPVMWYGPDIYGTDRSHIESQLE